MDIGKLFRIKTINPKILFFSLTRSRSSISDFYEYRKICKEAAENEYVFKTFKHNKNYRKILEHVSYELGRGYLLFIKANCPEFLDVFNKFKSNDMFGRPITFTYPGIGNISPTTLRYVKVLAELKKLFGDLTGFSVVEIGVGYGGQCKIIQDVYGVKEYYLIDLPEVLALADLYLSRLGVCNYNIEFEDIKKIDLDFDLFISNYAFTELTRDVQDYYFDNIIARSKRGYITCNFISRRYNIDSYGGDELFRKIKQTHCSASVLEEYPLTDPNNFIIYW